MAHFAALILSVTTSAIGTRWFNHCNSHHTLYFWKYLFCFTSKPPSTSVLSQSLHFCHQFTKLQFTYTKCRIHDTYKHQQTAAPVPTPWPTRFTVDFLSNITAGGEPNQRHYATRSKFWYDWTQQAQRVDHHTGDTECTKVRAITCLIRAIRWAVLLRSYSTLLQFYNTSGECTLLFSSHGMYRLLYEPYPVGEKECCLDMPTLMSLPPSWAANMTFAGEQTEPFSQIKVRVQHSFAPGPVSRLHLPYNITGQRVGTSTMRARLPSLFRSARRGALRTASTI